MKPRILVAFLIHFTIALPFAVEAQQVIFLARHAEQASEVEEPPLTEKGQQRARTLAAILKDAGINVIYTNPRLRSIQTAEPLAKCSKSKAKSCLCAMMSKGSSVYFGNIRKIASLLSQALSTYRTYSRH